MPIDKTIIAAGCVHIPYHDKVAWQRFVQYVRETKPNYLVLAGDFTECEGLSRHEQTDNSLQREHEAEQQALLELRDAAPEAVRYRVLGNHDFITRLDRAPKALQDNLLAGYQATVTENQYWRTKRYVCGKQGTVAIGPVRFWHGHRTGEKAGLQETMLYVREQGLGVSAHTHVPEMHDQIRIWSGIYCPKAYTNLGTFTDTSDAAQQGRWLERVNTDRWAANPVLIEVNDRRELFSDRQWNLTPLFS